MDLFFFTNFFPHPGGEFFIANEFNFSKKYSDQIFLFSLYGKGKQPLFESDKQVNFSLPVLDSPKNTKEIFFKGIYNLAPFGVHFVELISSKIIFAPKKLYWFFVSLLISRAVLSSTSYKQIIKKISYSKNPVLYFYWGDNLCWIIPYLKKQLVNKNVKIVLRLHRTDLIESFKSNYAPIRKQIFSSCDLIATISENGLKYLQTNYPMYKDKYTLSRLGVYDNGLNNYVVDSKLKVISVSNLVALKRIHLIFEILQQSKADIVWHHFGDGELMNELKHLTSTKRKGLEVVLHGFVTNSDLMTFYKINSLDFFINTSSIEGLPVSVMEALSFGVPVIATDVGGTSELVNDTLGKLIPENFSIHEVAAYIDSMKPEKISHLRNNARLAFEEKVMAEKNYTLFYEKLTKL